MKKVGLSILVILAISALGLWFGEGKNPLSTVSALPIFIIIFLTLISTRTTSKSKRIVLNLFLPVLYIGFWFVGTLVFNKVFNGCVDRGEEVRTSISKYFADNGRYPESLSDLKVKSLPGKLLLRPNLIEYRRTPSGYSLEFSDWLVIFSATDKEPFKALE